MADTIERLKELKEMLDGGLITKEEFDELKAKELGQGSSSENLNVGQQMEFSSVNQNITNGSNNGLKRKNGCITVLLIFGAIVLGIVLFTSAIVKGENKKQQIEQERIDALEQIVDVEKYYHMSQEQVIALHGEPSEILNRSEEVESFIYSEGIVTSFKNNMCDIYIYIKSFAIEQIEDVFLLFGIEPDYNTMEIGWMDKGNEFHIDAVNDAIDGIFVKINETNEKYADEIAVFFYE